MKTKYDKKRDEFSFPENKIQSFYSIALKVTSQCNLDCVFCCERKNNRYYSLNDIKKTIDKIAEIKPERICITGGEPLLRKDLMEIAKYIKGKGIAPFVATNGTLLTSNNEFLKHVSSVRLSVHGNEKIHDKLVKQKDAFKKAVAGAKIVKSLGVPLFFVSVVSEKNKQEVFNIAELCSQLNANGLYLFNLLSSNKGKKLIRSKKQLGKKFFDLLYAELLALKEAKNWKFKICAYDWEKDGQCIVVYPDGRVYTEPYRKNKNNRLFLGNLSKISMDEIFKRYPFKKNYLFHLKQSSEKNEKN